MKILILSIALAATSFTAVSAADCLHIFKINSLKEQSADSVKLLIDGDHAYYQKIVKIDSNIGEGAIYTRAIQFMAAKNFQQNYGYQEEGKLIFTTTQDLNINPVYVGDDDDVVEQYTAQFAVTLDLKNGGYRYTINNVVFFLPEQNGNKREMLYDVYIKSVNTDSRRIAKDAKKLIASFERYIITLTDDLYEGVEQKSAMYNSKF